MSVGLEVKAPGHSKDKRIYCKTIIIQLSAAYNPCSFYNLTKLQLSTFWIVYIHNTVNTCQS